MLRDVNEREGGTPSPVERSFLQVRSKYTHVRFAHHQTRFQNRTVAQLQAPNLLTDTRRGMYCLINARYVLKPIIAKALCFDNIDEIDATLQSPLHLLHLPPQLTVLASQRLDRHPGSAFGA